MLIHPQRQCLNTHVDQERIEGANAGANVSQAKGSCSNRECHSCLTLRSEHFGHRAVLAEDFCEIQAVVSLARSPKVWELVSVSCPVECAFLHDEPTESVSVSPEKLCRRVHHDVSAMFEWTNEVRTGRRIVHDQRQTIFVSDFGDFLDIRDYSPGIRDRFTVDRLSVLIDRSLHVCKAVMSTQPCLPAKLLEGVRELGHCSAIQFVGRHEVVSRRHEVAEGEKLSGVAT
mmetsp:Transcript_8656/g.16405  ORF Transcript_8656/g.16405 Transcript_8656/m.16405 type:complete len:230 (+) Transcript_8656:852-1541(+)